MNAAKNTIKNLKAGMAGRYQISKHTADSDGNPIPGTEVIVAPWFDNLITDQGLERLGTHQAGSAAACCQVGEGTATPAFTDTGLDVYVAGTNTVQSTTTSVQNAPPYFAWSRSRYRFAVGVAEGTLTEVGVGWATSGATLFSRALILDTGGSPTSITVQADEILDVTYEFRLYPPTADVEDVVTISGVDYDYIARACEVTTAAGGFGAGWVASGGRFRPKGYGSTAYAGNIGAVTGSPSGSTTGINISQFQDNAYTPGSLTAYSTFTLNIEEYLATGIRSIRMTWDHATVQVQFDPPIPKTVTGLVLELTFSISWARYTP